MKEQSKIPTSKVERASKFITTGAKVGGNYLKYYSKKLVNSEHTKDELNSENAEDIYNSLSELKGSALKVAQMLSMDKSMLPKAYSDKFKMAQYSAPPLSYPLVVKTFQKYFNASPTTLFDTFSKNAVNAASIGQVHKATKGDKTYAVKIQYPGVADSVSSDLKLVKPFALKLLNMNGAELDIYMQEVESKLIEETDYNLELQRSEEISEACAKLNNLNFPKYYPELSSERILTMDWLEGKHLKEFMETNPPAEVRNSIGQALWDFYQYQVHYLKQVHADPHPGNFLFKEDGTLGIIDFGCVKVIPEDFYEVNFKFHDKVILENDELFEDLLNELDFFHPNDSEEEKDVFRDVYKRMINILGKPFHLESFDFSDDEYFAQIYALSDEISNNKIIRSAKGARGSKHALYINRTYFGLFSLLNELKAGVIDTSKLGYGKPDIVVA